MVLRVRSIIIDLIPLLSIYEVGNLHLTQTVSGIRLGERKEIHPNTQGQGAC